MKSKLPKAVALEKSGAATLNPLSFVLHQIGSKSLNLGLTLTIKLFDSIMTGQLNQVSNNSMQSNELSDDGEPDSQQILIEEACQRWLNQKRLHKLKQAKLRCKPKFGKIAVSGLLKEFNKRHSNCPGHPNSVDLLDINEIKGTYILFSIFVLQDHLIDKVQPIHSTRWFNAYDSI